MGAAWSEEQISVLKKRWRDGDSAAVIAKALGLSRNAVLGKAHRLDLPTHHTMTTVQGRVIDHRKKVVRQPRVVKSAPNPVVLARLEKVMSAEPPPIIETIVAPVSLQMSLMDLGQKDCRWPSGEKEHTTFCGHNVDGERPYCTYHCRLAYRPAEQRERRVRGIADLVRAA